MNNSTILLVSFLTISATGCLTPRIDTFFVQGSRLQSMPADWRGCSYSIHQFRGKEGSVEERVYSDVLGTAMQGAGFAGTRNDSTKGLVVFWSFANDVENHEIHGYQSQTTGGGINVSPFSVTSTDGSTTGTVVTRAPVETQWTPTTTVHALTAFHLQIVILDGRQESLPELFRGRCLIKAIDQPVGTPFKFAAETILDRFPGAPSSTFNFEVAKLPKDY